LSPRGLVHASTIRPGPVLRSLSSTVWYS
jgi:hypothetical protein